MIFAKENGRTIPAEDKVFALSGRAKAAIAKYGKEEVINGTVGAMLDDDGKLVVLSSVMEAIRTLAPEDYAEYAPITGTPDFKAAIKEAVFGDYEPKGYVNMCATPGGTGSITSVIANYSEPGDTILTHDWCWANYGNICRQQGRNMETFRFFDEEGRFDIPSLTEKIRELSARQSSIVLLINTPAHNPTGYSLSDEDWKKMIDVINQASCQVILFLDIAYIDYAGDEKEVRSFLPMLEDLGGHVLTVFGYSASKTLTAYGMRLGAIVCLAKTEEISDEFRRVSEFFARSTWSNCNRSAQTVMGKIYKDPELLAKVNAERAGYRDMLLARGKAFEAALREEGVACVPFVAGFFVTIETPRAAEICKRLEEQNIFTLALARGIRASVASMSMEKCVKAAKAIAAMINEK